MLPNHTLIASMVAPSSVVSLVGSIVPMSKEIHGGLTPKAGMKSCEQGTYFQESTMVGNGLVIFRSSLQLEFGPARKKGRHLPVHSWALAKLSFQLGTVMGHDLQVSVKVIKRLIFCISMGFPCQW